MRTVVITSLLGLSLGLLTACPDPQGAFEDFAERVTDAAPFVDEPDAAPLADLPDVNGSFLVGFAGKGFESLPIFFKWDLAFEENATDGTGTLSLSSVALAVDTKEPVGTPTQVGPFKVSNAGEVVVELKDFPVPGEANPITGNNLLVDLTLKLQLKNGDLLCGTALAGKVTSPTTVEMTGSTIGLVRLEPGAALPPALTKCPETSDAGPQ